jgi:hypothetical protein
MPNLKFNPATDIPDLSGKIILVTGGEQFHLGIHSHPTDLL